MNIIKRDTLLSTFFISYFNYCPVIWICYICTKNSKLNRLHERYLRTIYNDEISTFKEPPENNSSVFIHIKNLQFLAIVMFNVVKGLS